MTETHASKSIAGKVILAPMVRGSELPFRQIIRRHGVKTCYSSMLRADEVVKALHIWRQWQREEQSIGSRPQIKDGLTEIVGGVPPGIVHEDGVLVITDIIPDPSPVVVQICGSDPTKLHEATRDLLELHYSKETPCVLEGIDLNLGCPQACALTGNFGAFLSENFPETAIACVKSMRKAIDLAREQERPSVNRGASSSAAASQPRLSCKIRLLDSDDQTIGFAKGLVEAGCELLAVHCRRRAAKSEGQPDLAAGRKLVESLPETPVIINGAILSPDDVRDTLAATDADGVMVATGFLINPRMLVESDVDPAILAAEYLESCKYYPPATPLCIRRHLRWIFRAHLEPKDKSPESFKDWRPRLWTFLVRPYLETLEQFRQVVALYVKLNGSPMPSSLQGQPEPSFKSIRNHPSRNQGDNGAKKRRIESTVD